MQATGWEIKPLGLIVLIAFAGLVLYFIVKRLRSKYEAGNDKRTI